LSSPQELFGGKEEEEKRKIEKNKVEGIGSATCI
jgi:hypothetical protein